MPVIFRVEGFGNGRTGMSTAAYMAGVAHCGNDSGDITNEGLWRLQKPTEKLTEQHVNIEREWLPSKGIKLHSKRLLHISSYLRLYFCPSPQSREADLAMTTESLVGRKTAYKVIADQTVMWALRQRNSSISSTIHRSIQTIQTYVICPQDTDMS